MARFEALVVREREGGYVQEVEERVVDDLPEGEVLIRVQYSSLNYKDALSATGHKGVTRNYPHTPGIDAAGVVEESSSELFGSGDMVLVTGYDLGMGTAGGYGQYIRVPAAWVVPLPVGLSALESMIYGTAGFTAALSVLKLQEGGVGPGQGEVLVTGATGGVGSTAVSILARAGYRVVAATGKMEEAEFLVGLGAGEVVAREEIADADGRPMLKERWAGVVDSVGGDMLATAIKATRADGVVTCCGLVAAAELATTVYPFILRGISLVGINSVDCAMDLRRQVWQRLAGEWKADNLDSLSRLCRLAELAAEIERILQGKQRGRVVVDLQG